MVSPIPPLEPLTVDGYLAFEEASAGRHEYVKGEVYAMTGASKRHNQIAGNIFARLRESAKGSPCQVFIEAVKLRVSDDVIYYPDVMVVCSDTDRDALVVREPCLVVEITSPDTARVDRSEKLVAYRRIPSLKAYLIVEQAARRIDRHWRDATGEWQREELVGEGAIQLPCPETTLTLDEIYEGLAPLTVRELEAIGYAV